MRKKNLALHMQTIFNGMEGRVMQGMKLGFVSVNAMILVACGSGTSLETGGATATASGEFATRTLSETTLVEFPVVVDNNTDTVQEYAAKVTACSLGDKPEVALQGQVPAALRATGFKGFNCNMELIGQFRGEGGNWSSAVYKGRGQTCAYHATATPTALRQNPGVPVIDITNPRFPFKTASLTTPAMIDPWEGLRVNQSRSLLLSANADDGNGGPDFDVYDLASDCTLPQLLSTTKLQFMTGNPNQPTQDTQGHEGNVSPDGRTYYIGDLTNKKYHAVDVTNPTRPKVIATFDMTSQSTVADTPHGMSVSKDGNRLYAVAASLPTPGDPADPNYKPINGFITFDVSEIQARKPNPKFKVVSAAVFRDGSLAQHTLPVKIKGKSHVVMVDEGGSGGLANAAAVAGACAAGMAPFPMARIYDMSDERNPKLVSKLGLETHNPENCAVVSPDVADLAVFTYGSHYCSVDNPDNATAMACSYFNSGVRVFDIRNPAQPKEIAYFNPPGTTTPVQGSSHVKFGQWRSGGPDWCASRLDFDFQTETLTTMCQDNGLVVMKFKNGVWPFSNSTPAS